MNPILSLIFSIVMHWLIVLLFAPLLWGVIAKVKAFFAGKIGPPVLQLYWDLAKLFRKRSVYGSATTWVFRAGPTIVFACALFLTLLIPAGASKAPIQFAGDIFLAVYILALARFFIIAAALDTGFSMEGMGAAREAFFSCLSELALFMYLITLAFLARSVSLSRMIGADVAVSWHALGPALLLVVASLCIVTLAENCRVPVDDPDTHLELTMIHEAMILDHSGVDLAYALYAAVVKLFVFFAVLVSILIPVRTHNVFWDMAIFFAGMIGLAVVVGVIESSMARLRLNRVRHLLLIAFALAFFGLVVMLWRR